MQIQRLKEWIQESENIVFFGGAGVSTESGIPDFRGKNGIFKAINEYGVPPETILSHSFFMKNQKLFFQYLKNNLIYPKAEPNGAHMALAELEAAGKLKAVITQNIDDLHQRAGSKRVLELHGTLYRNYCLKCAKQYDIDFVQTSQDVPMCVQCGGVVRPDVVLYEESLDQKVMSLATQYIQEADVLIIGGTSLNVYPAAGLLHYYKGKKLVLINKEKTAFDTQAQLVIHESIGIVFEKMKEEK